MVICLLLFICTILVHIRDSRMEDEGNAYPYVQNKGKIVRSDVQSKGITSR